MSDISALTSQSSSTAGDTALSGLKTAIGNVNTDKQEKGSGVTGNIPTFGASNVLGDSGKVAPSGTIVGTSDSQVLTNKTIAGGSNTVSGITESMLSTSDNTTLDVTTSKHGFVPKAPNDTAKFLRGDGTWAAAGSTVKTVVTWAPSNVNQGSGSTRYVASSGFSTTETFDVKMYQPVAGTIKNLYITTTTSQPSGGAYVLTMRKNGSNQAVVVSISASAAAGVFSDTTHSFTVAAGDYINIEAVNNGSTTSATLYQICFEFDPS